MVKISFLKTINLYRFTIITLFILAALTRFFNLDGDSISLDEGFCLRVTSLDFVNMMKMNLNDTNPPLYNLILFFWIKLWGNTETSVRSLSVILNLITFPYIYLIVKKLFNNKSISIFTLLIFTLSPFHIYYSQMVRSYSLFVLLATGSVYSFMNLLEDFSSNKIKKISIFIVFTSLMLYTHVYGWFILLFENCWILFLWYKNLKPVNILKWFKIELLIFFLFLPYFIQFISIVLKAQKSFWIAKPTIFNLAGTVLHFSGSPSLFVFFSILLFYFFWFYFKKKSIVNKNKNEIIFILLWLLIPVIVPFSLSQIITPFYLANYPMPSTIPFYILIAFTFNAINSLKVRNLALFIFLIITSISLFRNYTSQTRDPWRDVAMDIEQICTSDDLILVGADYCYYGPLKYYLKDHDFNIFAISKETFPGDSLKKQIYTYFKNNGKTIWLVSSHLNKYEEQVIQLLEKHYSLEKSIPYSFIDFYDRKKMMITVFKYRSQ